MQAMSLSDFGNMFEFIDKYIKQRQRNDSRKTWVAVHNPASCRNTKELLSRLLPECNMGYLTVYADPHYVAIVDEHIWQVDVCETVSMF